MTTTAPETCVVPVADVVFICAIAMKEAPGTMAAVRQALAGFNNSMSRLFQAGFKKTVKL